MLANIHIDETRETAVANTSELPSVVIYTDGSSFEHGIEAAAIMVKNGTTIRRLKYFLGSDLRHTVYEAEALAIILALPMVSNIKKPRTQLTIGTDNQAILLGMKNQRSKPSHYLLDKIHDSLEAFQVTQARLRGVHVKGYRKGKGQMRLTDGSIGWKDWKLKQRCKVMFIWTLGHKGISGNEIADEEAKLAAQGESSSLHDLPLFLRKKPLPVSISATRQKLKKDAKLRWSSEWFTSPRHERSKEIDNSLPSADYLHIIDQLTHNQASLLTQFRTGHVPLNETLFRIKRAPSPDCPHCGLWIKETIFHFLLACPRYAYIRGKLLLTLNQYIVSIPFLLGNPIGIPHFLQFVSSTKRLRTTFGEVRPSDDFKIKSKLELKHTRLHPLDKFEEP